MEAAEVVDRADRRRDGGAEHDAAQLAAQRQERDRRDHDPEEERQPAEARDRRPRALALLRALDEPQVARAAAHRRGQHDHDRERRERPVDHLEVVCELVARP